MQSIIKISHHQNKIVKHVIGAPRRFHKRTHIVYAKRQHKQTIDDPGGKKARLEHMYNMTTVLRPTDLVNIMLRKARRVYEINLFARHTTLHLQIGPHQATASEEYTSQLKEICEMLQKWNVAHIVKELLEESLDGPILEAIEIDLGIGQRIDEFEV